MSHQFPPNSPYRRLAGSLDALPNGFPPAEDEAELRLLAKLYTLEEADLAAAMLVTLETPVEMSERLGRDQRQVMQLLKEMSKKGLIAAGKTKQGRLGFGMMPFVVGIYEAQAGIIDKELALLFEDYYHKALGKMLTMHPQVHRIIPINESIRNDMEVRPFENAAEIINDAQSWGVVDCVCRTQKALIGEPCGHPLDVCMVLSQIPGAFDNSTRIRSLTHNDALLTLQRAANAGLVHAVSNNQHGLWYICNCCTCSCGILRGMAELGIANVVAHSAFVNQVNEDLCISCGLCIESCQFKALTLEATIQVNGIRCVGCGICVPVCPQSALKLVNRPNEALPPLTEEEWRSARATARGINWQKITE